jgi:hypothetical protein
MKFSDASAVEQICWTFRLAAYPPALNRSRINDIANGVPPYTDAEVIANKINTNINDLGMSDVLMDARQQYTSAHLVTDPTFTVTLDYGPNFKKDEWASIITKQLNRIIRGSLPWLEGQRSTFAQVVLHGIGPKVWPDQSKWRNDSVGIEDVFVPTRTLLTMENLPFFAVYRNYSYQQLWNMTHGPRVDPAWNMPLVEKSLAWVDQQAQVSLGTNWPEVWSPEKLSERMKEGGGGLYASDSVPTVDAFDFYYWDDAEGASGWRRRIILDAWGQPGVGGMGMEVSLTRKDAKDDLGKGQFLYD